MKLFLSLTAALVLCSFCVALHGEPVRVDPENPHYYFHHGKPLLLITSAEHYGAVINRSFDYVAYFDALKAHGLNYTRIYPGAMFEPMGKFMPGNTLAPTMNDLIVPWARSSTPGYLFGGNRFDLDNWDPEYFARLKDFIAKADERGIYVEICFFNSQYSDTWPLSPLYYKNNVQKMQRAEWRDAQSMKFPDLVAREDAYVKKITEEVNGFDNVILEDCDEPADIGSGVLLAGPWVSHLADTVISAERPLQNKHLLAQELDGALGSAMDFTRDPRLNIIVAQYTWGRDPNLTGGELGGIKALDQVYDRNKPLEMNETYYYPLDYKNDVAADSRAESWEFIVGGGTGFNQLNGAFSVEDPAGKTTENEQLLNGLRNLMTFMGGFSFDKMHPDKTTMRGPVEAGRFSRLLSESGKQYALYVHHSIKELSGYEAVPGHYQESLEFKVPAGRYRISWVEPATGKTLSSDERTVGGGMLKLKTPPYTTDLAMSMLRAGDTK